MGSDGSWGSENLGLYPALSSDLCHWQPGALCNLYPSACQPYHVWVPIQCSGRQGFHPRKSWATGAVITVRT